MKQNTRKPAKTKRTLRKTNKPSIVDTNMWRRRRVATLLFVIAIIFIACEFVGVLFAKRYFDERTASEIADEMVVNLGTIDSAIRSGDLGSYERALDGYKATLETYRQNDYVRAIKQDTVKQLESYTKLLEENSENINTLIRIHASLDYITVGLEQSEDSLALFESLQTNLKKLSDSLTTVKNEELADAVKVLTAYSKELTSLIDTTRICYRVCPTSTFTAKKAKLQKLNDEYMTKFSEANEAIVAKYSPSQYVLLLK